LIFAIGVVLFFIIQTPSFQTYLGDKATDWLSKELKTQIKIEKININFFHALSLNGVFIKDLKNDTLLYIDQLNCDIKTLNLKQRKIHLKQIELINGTAKAITYKNDTFPNYQFLIDYFSSPTDTIKSEPFDFDYGNIKLSNLNLIYKDENDTTKTNGINFANISVKQFYGGINGLLINKDTISVELDNIRLKESTGLAINKFSSVVKISPIGITLDSMYLKTENSLLVGHYYMKSKSWEDYSDFLNKVKLDLFLKDSSSVAAQDIGYFAEQLLGNTDKVELTGLFNGKINSLYGKSVKLKFANQTKYIGNFYLQDITDISNAFFHLGIDELTTNSKDLAEIHVPPFDKHNTLQLPDIINKLGNISYKGLIIGKLNDIIAKGKLKSNIGNIETDASIKNLTETKILPEYKGKIKTQNFNLGLILGNKDIGLVSMDMELEGKAFNLDQLEANLIGNVQQLTYNNYDYKNIVLTGDFSKKKFNGKFECRDENADLDFYGSADLNNKIPELDFISTINKLNLTKLNFIKPDSINAEFSSQVAISLKGSDIDHMNGRINFDNSILCKHKR